ncbi:arginyl-tRNA synthetase [Thermoactinomyces sp. DSM 45891]|uniref:arginine--tRNA ligase n=1 Tax=Thermoactinomyces sp. DSM 45891 TaxID=1761907 RepID=UPI0009182C29|nr:arginine--tRNA ligase [Thermoactinomyces sp. DSM 45891]SFX80104.1 arginyl-tRNA synthetase [Thermoactinomyces sp. DSM 45891]
MSVLTQMKETLKEQIRQAILQAELVTEEQIPDILLEVPKEKSHGDWATNVAMQLTRIARRNPREIANVIVEKLDQSKAQIHKIEIAGPGFINFTMDRSFLTGVALEIHKQKEEFGRSGAGKGERVNVEFVSANPTGSLHLGHARGAAVGDALCNVLDAAGYDVTREYYINDAGNQMNKMALSLEARYFEGLGIDWEFPEDGYHGQDMVQIAEQIIEVDGKKWAEVDGSERLTYFQEVGREKLLNKIETDLKGYRVGFDKWFSEKSLYESNVIEQTLEELKNQGCTYEQDGALWLRSTDFGDDKDRVLVKQDGSYTYLTPDIAYHRNKLSRGFDRLINIWGADHHGYIARMKAALQALGHSSDTLDVMIIQLVKLFQGGEVVKMSKRTGKAVTLVDLMEEVGVDATRYFFAMRSQDTHLDFDMDLAMSQSNENPVYYVQYAHARIHSVFRQAGEKGIAVSFDPAILSRLSEDAEYDLLQKLAEFPDEIASAAAAIAPHRVIRYLYDLSTQFHSYYGAHRVVTEDVELSQARLALLECTAQVIRNGLSLVGVTAPERM